MPAYERRKSRTSLTQTTNRACGKKDKDFPGVEDVPRGVVSPDLLAGLEGLNLHERGEDLLIARPPGLQRRHEVPVAEQRLDPLLVGRFVVAFVQGREPGKDPLPRGIVRRIAELAAAAIDVVEEVRLPWHEDPGVAAEDPGRQGRPRAGGADDENRGVDPIC